ncbi:glutathione S-transferase family protein [Parasphingopyxis sp. CP4]|uniref:glutathione S-transferase family protein n=1 Tax=Parasphingopyxis sp. CP4 TaxID=2724527 RepID=UPI0015A20988|nr:glutathione S-transferase family protein [Parasphingopyxis sp. CP4]QLC21177.1 glutathione S-transferase family protein [Parasphingopyxis sp. CP4]
MALIHTPASPIPEQLEGVHLFHFDGAPCAQRVRFALGEKGLARGREVVFDSVTPDDVTGEDGKWVSRRVSLVKKEHMTDAYAAIHPDMVVPALVHDGRLYLESMDIITYLDEAFGGDPMVPADPELRTATMARVEQAKKLHLSLRYVTFHWGLGRLAMLKPKERNSLSDLAANGQDGENLVSFYSAFSTRSIPDAVNQDHLTKLYAAFCELDVELADGRTFLMGDTLTIADPFWAMKVLRLKETGYPFPSYHPALNSWFERIRARPAFQNEVMGRNRMNNRFFTAKSAVDNLLGRGLKRALADIAA